VTRPPVIVSLTTIPARNGTLGPTIASLLSQLLAPDEIRVYAPPDCERPAALGGIAWVGGIADLGPLTKLSAVRDLALPDDAIVVTCDDDQIYDPRWLETLVRASRAYPNCAVGLAGWNARGFLLGERGRDHYEWVRPPSTCDVLEGYAGVAYRRSFFDDAIWDPPTSCRMVDDVWISGYLHRLGIVRRVTDHKLCRPAPSDRAGLHTRGDFVALNRAAARMMFGVIPATAPALSILIPSLASRRQLLERLLACLGRQGHRDEIEILVEVDDGRATTGTKRNRLVAKARGAYICHIDDDDLVAPDYLETILDAIRENPGVDVLWIRGQRRIVDGEEAGVLTFDYGCGPHVNGRIVDDALWRQVGHLCPIRAAIAKATPFPELTVGEDLRWANAVAPKIVTSARAGRPGQVLYYYEFSPHKKKSAMIDSSRRAIDSSRPPSAASPTPTPTSTPTPPRRDPARAARRAARAQVLTPTTPPAGSHAEIFAPQYTSSSGPGSALSVTVPYRDFLARFIREHDVRSIVDLGCGDLEIMSHVDLGDASYLGIDVIAERIERNRKKLGEHPRFSFSVGDARTLPMSSIAGFDLLIIKDVLQHWTNAEVAAWLARWHFAVQRPHYALVTNCNYGPTVNRDVAAGGWRAIDLTKAPFGVGKVVLRWALPRGPHVDYKDVVLLERA
jgi:SAM-dependent methyltransferase